MKSRDEITHVRIESDRYRRQWVPVREAHMEFVPVEMTRLDDQFEVIGRRLTLSFRVKRRLAPRVTNSKIVGLFACSDNATAWVPFVEHCIVNGTILGIRDGQDQGIVFDVLLPEVRPTADGSFLE